MRFVKFTAACLAVAAFCSSVTNAGGFETFAVGTKARAMGGAFRAIADDWTAAYYNPAGYARILDNQLGGTMSFIHLRDEINPTYRHGGIYESGVLNDQINYNKHEVYSNPSGGVVVKVPAYGDELVVGLSGYQPFDRNITWEMYELPLAYNDQLALPGNQYSMNLDVAAFQLTLSRQFMEEKLALGIGLQLLRADLIYTNIYFRDNPYDESFNVRPWDKVTEWTHNDGNGYGFGLNLGMLYDVNENLTLAVTAAMPFDVTVDGSSELEFYMPYIETMVNRAITDPEIPDPGTPEYLFFSGSKVADTASFKTKIKLPPSLGLGVAYQVSEKFKVALDAQYTIWSRFDGLEFIYSDHRGLIRAADSSAYARAFFTQDLSNPISWKDAGKIMVGGIYELRDYVTLLAGGSVDQSPARNSSTVSPQLYDLGDKYSFSGGVVFHYDGRWDFGLASSFTHHPDLRVPTLTDSDNDGLKDNFNGLYKASTYETVLSVTHRF